MTLLGVTQNMRSENLFELFQKLKKNNYTKNHSKSQQIYPVMNSQKTYFLSSPRMWSFSKFMTILYPKRFQVSLIFNLNNKNCVCVVTIGFKV